MFIGRESELEALNQMYMQDKFQLFKCFPILSNSRFELIERDRKVFTRINALQ